jgi:glutathione S-transferase
MFEQRYIQPSIGRLRYWTLTGKLDQFARDVATARALGNRALDVLDGELGKRPFITGDTYTIADISIFAYSHVAADANFDLSARPNLTTWFDRVRRLEPLSQAEGLFAFPTSPRRRPNHSSGRPLCKSLF